MKTPAEMEAESLRLAFQLQQEEHAAFMQAVRVSSPAPAAGAAHYAPGAFAEADNDTMDAEDESLRLAMQLQQEELQWHAAAAGQHVFDCLLRWS